MIVSQPKRDNFCFGDTPTLADICLIPQLGNARRYGCDLAKYPTILAIEKNATRSPPSPTPRRKNSRMPNESLPWSAISSQLPNRVEPNPKVTSDS